MKRFLIGYALLTTCLLFMQREAQKPLLVYHADSKYAITGKVEDKKKIGNIFTLQVFSNLSIFSLKTSKDSLTMIEETPSKQSSERLMDWGMMSNGKCLTANRWQH